MELLRFEVRCELRIRSLSELGDGGNVSTEVTFLVQPPASIARPHSEVRNELDPIFLKRAELLKRRSPVTVSVPREWFDRRLTTWRDEIIDKALEQTETSDFGQRQYSR